ncbi:hypothetical protein N752_02930 [Desulforamulus aquiferis]|nr:hypothetical protein [Desulforamulus aquiferis]RYD06641.1 hypothetical protein N752_02930 [Desulforamulus aquiferis]
MERAEAENPSVAIEAVQDHLPALYFVFGRIRTEELASEVGREWDFLFHDEKEKVLKAITDTEKEHPDIFQRGHRRMLRKLLQQGIGYHHAGISPILKTWWRGFMKTAYSGYFSVQNLCRGGKLSGSNHIISLLSEVGRQGIPNIDE